jgi:glucan 1,3-beta-glucosidase
VIFDIHRYQCFDPKDIELDIYGHLQKAAIHWKSEADQINAHLGLATYVGEWSLGMNLDAAPHWITGTDNQTQQKFTSFHETLCLRAYAASQLVTFERYLGWFFWSYKTETSPAWCFRECINRGWLPEQFDSDADSV